METEIDAFSGEWEEETSGALIRRSSKVKTERTLKEIVKDESFKMETEADEVPSLISKFEAVENDREICSDGEAKTEMTKEAELSERMCVKETVCRENEELLEPGEASENLFVTISLNDSKSKVTTMPDKTQLKARSDGSVYVEEEEGLWKCRHCSWVYPVMNSRVELIQKHKEHCRKVNNIQAFFEKGFPIEHKFQEGSESRIVLDKEREVIDYEKKDIELVKDEKVIQTMTEINENQTSVSETIIQNSQDGFVNAQDEARQSDHCSRTPENSTSTGKVEEIVRVLKEQQSHDLLCPVCGSCITKRVILRKRKRTVSVDRWVQTPDDDAQAALLEGGQQITQNGNDQPETSQEDSDETEAYGCLACFSVFFRRVVDVQHLATKSESSKETLADQDPSSVVQDIRDRSDKEKEIFYWLPFQNLWRKETKKEPKSAAGKEFRSSLSHEVKDRHGVSTESMSYQGSIMETKTLKDLISMENVGTKETKYTLTESTNITRYDKSSQLNEQSKKTKYTLTESTNITRYDKSSQLNEQFLPAERSEDQLAELHLFDSTRLYAKSKEHEHAETEASDEYASKILPDVLQSNIGKSSRENVGSEKTEYTISEETNITQYVNGSDKFSQMKEQFPPAKRSEDQLAELHLDDARSDAKREEQENASTKTRDGGVSIILPDVLPRNIKKNIPEEGIREDSATYDQGSNNFSAVPRDEELQQDAAGQKDDSHKTDYMCNCIPISVERVWSIWSLKENITDEQLKEPLLPKEKLKKDISVLPDGTVSHDSLQSDKLLIQSQRPDEKGSEGTSPLLSSRVDSSGLLWKRDPTTLYSEKTAISTHVTVPPVQTVIEVESVGVSEPSDVATTVPEQIRTTTTEPQATQIVTEWDILKSTVYGGLTVSLTSLGVVSSTAGGEAKSLTVIAISLSNLVAGLFVILNNILDLEHYHKDQFIERIGHSSWFNGSVAIVSYIIFGSLAPITYAFSFQSSDDSNDTLYKFIATSAVSLVCIILLALWKARISKKSYIRTVTLYIVTGFWSSVAGFFAGEYIKKLLEKWGL